MMMKYPYNSTTTIVCAVNNNNNEIFEFQKNDGKKMRRFFKKILCKNSKRILFYQMEFRLNELKKIIMICFLFDLCSKKFGTVCKKI